MAILLYWQTPSEAPSLQLYKESFHYARVPLWSTYSHYLPWPRHLTTTYVFPVFIGSPLSECHPVLITQILPFRSALYHFATLSFFFLVVFAVHVSVYMGLHVLWSVYGGVPWSTYGGQRSTCKSQSSFSTTGSSVLARVTIGLEQWVLTYWAILLACPPFLERRSCWKNYNFPISFCNFDSYSLAWGLWGNLSDPPLMCLWSLLSVQNICNYLHCDVSPKTDSGTAHYKCVFPPYGMLSSLSFLEENLHIDFLVLLPLLVE